MPQTYYQIVKLAFIYNAFLQLLENIYERENKIYIRLSYSSMCNAYSSAINPFTLLEL
jgi:hypothetical protein